MAADTKRHAYASFFSRAAAQGYGPPKNDVCWLEVAGTRYPVVQAAISFAANEVPQATCALAVGRDVSRLADVIAAASTVHTAAIPAGYPEAKIVLRVSGEYRPDGTLWPVTEQVIFEGRIVGGVGPRKADGRIAAMVVLAHWLVDLTTASATSGNTSPANPLAFNAAAVSGQLAGAGGTDKPAFTAEARGADAMATATRTDFWAGIKTIFSAMAADDRTVESGFGNGDRIRAGNPLAVAALARFEGVVAANPYKTSRAYQFGVKLPLAPAALTAVGPQVSDAVARQSVAQYAGTTVWDKLVGEYCPLFGLAVIPMVDRALVVADLPSFRGVNAAALIGGVAPRAAWRTLTVADEDVYQTNPDVSWPVRGVGVFLEAGSPTFATVGPAPAEGGGSFLPIAGRFVASAVDAGVGSLLVVRPPLWLQAAASRGAAATGMGLAGGGPVKANGGQAKGAPPPPGGPKTDPVAASALSTVFNAYARNAYLHHTLRGRTGLVSGKLRFDVAPGSVVRIESNGEPFVPGDVLTGGAMYGVVTRVTIQLNGETGQAGTAFDLAHLRTEAENELDQFSSTEHPLFGTAFHGNGLHGAPLVPAFDVS